jgi:hypothetical protein
MPRWNSSPKSPVAPTATRARSWSTVAALIETKSTANCRAAAMAAALASAR